MKILKDIKDLALHAAKGTVPADLTNFSLEEGQTVTPQDVRDAFKEEISRLGKDYNSYRRNKYDIFEIIQETADQIAPVKVIQTMGQFAEFKRVKDGEKASFRRKLGRRRAKSFLTQVGLSGVYETFRLDNDTYDVYAHARGGAAAIDFERFQDGSEVMAEYMDIVIEGLEDSIYGEVQKTLHAAAKNMSTTHNNRVSSNAFSAEAMQKLVTIVRSYGSGAVIFASPEFVTAMGPDAIVPGTSAYQGIYSPKDIVDIANNGRINSFRGTPIITLPQSFTDENNNVTQIDPQVAYVLPSGGEKVVKVVIEGNTIIKDFENRDNSIELHAYYKIGSAIHTYNNWASYINLGIEQTYVGDIDNRVNY